MSNTNGICRISPVRIVPSEVDADNVNPHPVDKMDKPLLLNDSEDLRIVSATMRLDGRIEGMPKSQP
jgi:hypothetical protein